MALRQFKPSQAITLDLTSVKTVLINEVFRRAYGYVPVVLRQAHTGKTSHTMFFEDIRRRWPLYSPPPGSRERHGQCAVAISGHAGRWQWDKIDNFAG